MADENEYMREAIDRGLIVQWNRAIDAAIAALDRIDAEHKMSANGSFYMRRALHALYKKYAPAQGIEAPSGGETLLSGSTEGESPVRESDAP